ncbi:cyclic-di-AMP receptor [Alteribacillus sp. HJP-4]|uniref:cyclic-di-AMP receptor n=1 Tax=Alteribacillus sp. HJP-4 TaxID=2775394 RepID=UPI0035CCDF3F
MKLMVCIVNDYYTAEIERGMKKKGYKMTELASSGGFLKKGNTTFLFGVENEDIDPLKTELKSICTNYEQKRGKKLEKSHRYTSFVLSAKDAALFGSKMP